MILKGYIIIFTYIFLLLMVIGPIIKKIYNVEASRKIIHISLFAIWIFIDMFIKNTIHQVIIPIIFIIVNILSNKFKIFKSIERESDNCYGTIYFALSITIIMLVVYIFPEFYYCSGIAMFCLTFGDGFASLIGYNTKSPKIYKNKTLNGCIACFIASTLSIIIFEHFYNTGINILMSCIIGVAVVIFELIGGDLDNIFVTLSSFILSYSFLKFPTNNLALIIGIIEIIFIVVFILKFCNNKEKQIS